METANELYHYGVLGMKWGVRRSLEELRSSNQSGSKGGHNHAVSKLSSHRDKINKKIGKLEKKESSLQKTRDREKRKGDVRAAKYRQKAARYEHKAYNSLLTSKRGRQNAAFKAHKMYAKAHSLEAIAKKTEAKISKNQVMMNLYKTNLSDINKELITNGQDFLYMKPNGMPYTLADD